MPVANPAGSGRPHPPDWNLTVVVPVYNENETIGPLVDAIAAQLPPRSGGIVLVDDGSTDGSGAICDAIAARRGDVTVVHFPNNQGKTRALAAGFARVTGNVVITMDGDLQDQPDEIPRFLEALAGGLDLVCGWKRRRHDPWSKRAASRVFNGAVSLLFGLRLHDANCGFKAMRSEVARAAILKHDYHRLIPVVAAAQGFRVGEIEVTHHPRKHGVSKFGMERYWRGARDAAHVWWEIRTGRILPLSRVASRAETSQRS